VCLTYSRRPPRCASACRYTKLGYSGNNEPSFLVPTAVATAEDPASAGGGKSDGVADLDYYVGEEVSRGRGGGGGGGPGCGRLTLAPRATRCWRAAQAVAHVRTHNLNYPIRHGLIDNWNNMEKLWQRCYYDYLRVEPDEHFVMLVRRQRGGGEGGRGGGGWTKSGTLC
jgi:actin-related protein 3